MGSAWAAATGARNAISSSAPQMTPVRRASAAAPRPDSTALLPGVAAEHAPRMCRMSFASHLAHWYILVSA